MAEMRLMQSTSSELLRIHEQRMHTVTAVEDAADSPTLAGAGAERLGYLLRRAIKLMESDIQAASQCLQDASRLLGADQRNHAEDAPEVPRFQSGGLARWQTRLVVEYIEQNLGSKIRARELAEALRFSRGHFSRAFKRTFGVPMMRYVFGRRVERAKSMLTGSRDRLSEVALSCGFADQSHLNRMFRRVVGMTPGLWRRAGADATHTKAGAAARARSALDRGLRSTGFGEQQGTNTG
jgi:AraC family transcriptional regulator